MKTFPRGRLGLFNVNKTLEIFANVAELGNSDLLFYRYLYR